MIAALQADNARMSATLRAHDQLIQTPRLRIATLKKQVFGKSSEKIEREIEQLELALEDLLVARAESAAEPMEEDVAEPAAPLAADEVPERKPRRRPRVSEATPRERRELDPGACCPERGGDLRLVGEDVSEILDSEPLSAVASGARSRRWRRHRFKPHRRRRIHWQLRGQWRARRI